MKWTISNAVFVADVDDEHKGIFDALRAFQDALTRGSSGDCAKGMRRLLTILDAHFAHEERLMRAARYGSLRWHKRSHDNASKQVHEFARRIEAGDIKAGDELTEHLTQWLHEHTGTADKMMGASLRNHMRSIGKLTVRAGTRRADACAWATASGEAFDPLTGNTIA